MTLPPQQFCVRWNSYHTNLQTVFPKLLSTENFADVTLACENRQLKCHKVVLSACSAYFERLLVQNPCKHPIIFMKDMRFSEMSSLVDFMYKGEVNVTQDDLPSLLKSAEALQIRGLCASDNNGLTNSTGGSDNVQTEKSDNSTEIPSKDYTLASNALMSQMNGRDETPSIPNGGQPPNIQGLSNVQNPNNAMKKRKLYEDESFEGVKEECVEEDGLYYGDIDNDGLEFHDTGEDSAIASSSTGNPASGIRVENTFSTSYLRDKRNTKVCETGAFIGENDSRVARLAKMNTSEIQTQFAKYGFTTSLKPTIDKTTDSNITKDKTAKSFASNINVNITDEDYYKQWLERNDELEVSLKTVSGLRIARKVKNIEEANVPICPEIDITSKFVSNKSANVKSSPKGNNFDRVEFLKQNLIQLQKNSKKGRPALYKGMAEVTKKLFKGDLDQFLEGKEISDSGLSRKDLEKFMMGKCNPNRRYSNEAMWAALMDVKSGGSIYRAAQTHQVPRKSLRNWMKRCHIKSSFPMPQQLKQFVENNRKQKTQDFDIQTGFGDGNIQDSGVSMGNYHSNLECDFDLGKHFLSLTNSGNISSDDDLGLSIVAQGNQNVCFDEKNGDNYV